uniref:Uncharacterized protein n=1 Tax=Rhizophora mucronata TaxID=61149 RepID=A0A2P2QG66_RHIMU
MPIKQGMAMSPPTIQIIEVQKTAK